MRRYLTNNAAASATYIAQIRTLMKQKKYKLALQLVREAPQSSTQMRSLGLRSAGKLGEASTALQILESMKKQGDEIELLHMNAMLEACSNSHDTVLAEACFKKFPVFNISPDVSSYSILIDAFGKSGDWKRAVGLFSEMQRKGLEADSWAFGTVIAACARGGQSSIAAEMLEEMKTRGVQPTQVVYNCVIAACAKSRKLITALSHFEEMKKQGIQPNPGTYSSLLKVCSRSGRFDLVNDFIQEMKEQGIPMKQGYYVSLITYFSTDEKWERCMEVLETMAEKSIQPNFSILSDCMRACNRAGFPQISVELFVIFKDLFFLPVFVYEELFFTLGILRAPDEAIRIIENFRINSAKPPSPKMYERLIRILVKDFNHTKAFQYYQDMCAVGYEVSAELVPFILKIFLHFNYQKEALDLVRTTVQQKYFLSPPALRQVLSLCEKLGEWELGLKIMHKAMEKRSGFMDKRYNAFIRGVQSGMSDDQLIDQWKENTSINKIKDNSANLECSLPTEVTNRIN